MDIYRSKGIRNNDGWGSVMSGEADCVFQWRRVNVKSRAVTTQA